MPELTRRDFVKNAALAAAALNVSTRLKASDKPEPESSSRIALHWLEETPSRFAGATCGVPWQRGSIKAGQAFALQDEKGEAIPLQSWPLAYWPDGSLKWSAHAIDLEKSIPEKLYLSPGIPVAPSKGITVNESPDRVEIDTGVIRCRIAKRGGVIIESITREGRELVRNGALVCLRQPHAQGESATIEQERFIGETSAVTVEQKGPVRAVVKLEGKHKSEAGRTWLPFVLRLYFCAGTEAFRIMHTIIYDGNPEQDFIRGLGLTFSVAMQGELYDRHIRFAGEGNGLWAEATRTLTGLRRDPGKAFRDAQTAGQVCPPIEQMPESVRDKLQYVPAFGDFFLYQPTADSFEIRKRTKEGWTWLNSAFGKRAAGLGFVGSPTGGVAFGIRNFWQSYPGGLDIRGATGDAARVTLWLWSPESRPMDMRFYHDEMGMDTYEKQTAGLDITYEDYEPGFGTAVGVARTSEMMVWALPATPSHETLVELAGLLNKPPMLVCDAAYYNSTNIFGKLWAPLDHASPARKQITDDLDWYFDFYKKEVEQRHWYGFWNYGDVMHTYDADRHVWRYDVGGFAWDNSELSTDLWIWYYFLCSGRADVFRMAEALTRHTGEVDVYHAGRFAGLGTRHGVVHWGDSAKQLRISTAMNRRFYYYLTADERVGDLLHELVDADRKLVEVDPSRKIRKQNNNGHPAHINFGTDWGSLAGAWLTEWERTGNTHYRDKIVAGMKSIANAPRRWFSGAGSYEPDSGTIYADNNQIDVSHLSSVFGLVEVNAELLQLLDVPEFERAWIEYCVLYNASPEEQAKALGEPLKNLNLQQGHSRLTAFAARHNNDAKLAARAWSEFFAGKAGLRPPSRPLKTEYIEGPNVLNPVDEAPWISTNAVAQWGLAAIENLALIGDQLPSQ